MVTGVRNVSTVGSAARVVSVVLALAFAAVIAVIMVTDPLLHVTWTISFPVPALVAIARTYSLPFIQSIFGQPIGFIDARVEEAVVAVAVSRDGTTERRNGKEEGE